MTARRTSRVVTAALVVGACAALALAGCSAGQISQTATQVPAVPGANVTVGTIALRDLMIQYSGPDGYEADGDAPLIVRIFNDGQAPITLVGATADKAEAVTLAGGPGAVVSPGPTAAPASPSAAPSPATSPSPQASPSPATSPSPGASPSPNTSPSPAEPSPAPPTSTRLSIQIPPQSYALLVPGQDSHLQLTGLKQRVVPGDWVTVTFTFDNGVSIPVQIPMGPPATEVPRATPVVEGGHE